MILGTNNLVVKAQIHAGGRGKGTFANGFRGGVHLCKSPAEARDLAAKMLGQTLVTHQTGPAGRVVNKVLIAESAEIAREIYFAILLDRATAGPIVVASTEGGLRSKRSRRNRRKRFCAKKFIPWRGFRPIRARSWRSSGVRNFAAESGGEAIRRPLSNFHGLRLLDGGSESAYRYPRGEVLALDAKFNFDDNALYRHPELAGMRDTAEEDPREVEASKHGLNYIGLDGNIACLVNGAGLAMATMDIIKFYGGSPANFLDVGGGATEEQVTEAFKILVSDAKVKAILVNIFGGIMKCDVIAQGIINAVKAVKLPVPLVVRLQGTTWKLERS